MHKLFNQITVLDGGLATFLADSGHKFDNDPLWGTRVLIDRPEAVCDAHQQFLNAGAEIIETCSYQAYIKTMQTVLNVSFEKSIEILQLSVKVAKDAVNEYQSLNLTKSDKQILVAGSIGSFGGTLCDGSEFNGKYIDSVPANEIFDYYSQQARILSESGCDLLAFETVPSLQEAEIICKAIQGLPPIPIWISFSCKDEKHLCYGDDEFSSAVTKLCLNPKISALGINCTHPNYISHLLKTAQFGLKPFVVYPNSGEDWIRGKGYFGENLAPLHSLVPEWVQLGAKIIGGCCRIGPKEISQITFAVKNLSNPISSLNDLKLT